MQQCITKNFSYRFSLISDTSRLLFNRDTQYYTILEEEVILTTHNGRRDGLQNNVLQLVIPTRKNLASTGKGCSWPPLF